MPDQERFPPAATFAESKQKQKSKSMTQSNSTWKNRLGPSTSALAVLLLFGGLFISNVSTRSEGLELALEPAMHGVIAQNNAPEVPMKNDLAGEPVPMNSFGVREHFDRELVVNTYRHSSTMLYFKRAARWFPLIEPILDAHGLPDDFKYLAIIESGLSQAVSPAGAAGFWQFMKATAPSYGLKVNGQVDERYHVEKATHAACQYLIEAREEFGSWALAAASYNMGRAGVRKALKSQGVESYWDLHLNEETARYVYRLLAVKAIFEEPENFGFYIQPEALYAPHEGRTLWRKQSIGSLAAFALEEGANLKTLKALNPWLRSDRLSIAEGDSIGIMLPPHRFD